VTLATAIYQKLNNSGRRVPRFTATVSQFHPSLYYRLSPTDSFVSRQKAYIPHDVTSWLAEDIGNGVASCFLGSAN
jgi:hypothetical protein